MSNKQNKKGLYDFLFHEEITDGLDSNDSEDVCSDFEFTFEQLTEFQQHSHKYICPSCGQVAFSKADAELSCYLCHFKLREVNDEL